MGRGSGRAEACAGGSVTRVRVTNASVAQSFRQSALFLKCIFLCWLRRYFRGENKPCDHTNLLLANQKNVKLILTQASVWCFAGRLGAPISWNILIRMIIFYGPYPGLSSICHVYVAIKL